MIHIVTSENRHLYAPRLSAMPVWRRDPCGWVDLTAFEDGEVDDSRAIDLLGFDDDMDLEVGLRLRPTGARGGLADTFGHLVAPGEASKTGPDVWEAARLFTTPAYRAKADPDRGARVFEAWAAAMELALVNGIARLVGVIDLAFYPGIADSPIDTRLVGLPRTHAHRVIAGAEIAVSRALLDRAREALGVQGRIGYHIDELDLRAFGGLAAVQHQVIRAQVPQCHPGSARDEELAARTLYQLNDGSGAAGRPATGHDSPLSARQLNA